VLLVLAPLASLSLAGQEHGRTIPLADIKPWAGIRFRTIQVRPKDLPAPLQQAERAVD